MSLTVHHGREPSPEFLEEVPDDAASLWICPPFEVLGRVRDVAGMSWGLYLQWRDADGQQHQWVMPARMRPNDPAPIGTFLLAAADAQAVAEAAGDLWRDRPGYYSVEVPLDVAAGLDIGSVVRLTWPLSGLAAGALGQIVGEQVRSGDGTTTFQVLMTRSIGDFNPAEFGAEFTGATA